MKPRAIPGVEALKPYNPPLEGRENFLRLDFNEWLGSPPPGLTEFLADFDAEKLNMYPEADSAEAAVALHFDVPQENVLLANGTDEAFCNIYRTYLGKGEKVLLPDPGYTMMEFYATLCEAEIIPWNLEAPEFIYDLSKAEDFLKAGGKCITFANPNNPTGSEVSQKEIKDLIAKWPDRLFVVDEAYIDFGGESLAAEAVNQENLLVLRTFSKAWSLAGLRLGVTIGSASMISELKKMWSPYSVNVLGLSLLTFLLPAPEWIKSVQEWVGVERDRLKEAMANRKLKAHFAGGNFFLLYVGETVNEFIKGFEERQIRLRDQSSKRGLKGWVRISFGEASATDRFLEVLDEVLS